MAKEAHLTPPSHWPIVGSVGLTCLVVGLVNWLHANSVGSYLMGLGAMIVIGMMVGWFAAVIREGLAGLNADKQEAHGFRLGMLWFIFTEVMFFATFFGVLFYVRVISGPHIGGEIYGVMTHVLEWPQFHFSWPLLHNPNPAEFLGPKHAMGAWGIPAINTLILLTSGVTITIAHWGIVQKKHKQAVLGQLATILLGILFLYMQAHEYIEAYGTMGLRLDSGAYGSTFFMLTGFHGLHVTLGTIMLIVILGRILCRHFTPEHHFAFEAVAWYWHFVDVVWLLLFVFVYWL
jgi:cytochrome c oxidase subunit III